MRNERSTGWSAAWAAVAALGLAGCASEVGPGDPAAQNGESGVVSTTENAATAVSAESHRSKDHDGDGDGTCSPLACCFPTQGGGWQDDPLENRLKQLGCSTPAPYQQTTTAFWAWSECPFTFDLVATVFKYSGSPDSAHFVENPCLPFHLGKAQVVFDPICPTCTGGSVQGPPLAFE